MLDNVAACHYNVNCQMVDNETQITADRQKKNKRERKYHDKNNRRSTGTKNCGA